MRLLALPFWVREFSVAFLFVMSDEKQNKL